MFQCTIVGLVLYHRSRLPLLPPHILRMMARLLLLTLEIHCAKQALESFGCSTCSRLQGRLIEFCNRYAFNSLPFLSRVTTANSVPKMIRRKHRGTILPPSVLVAWLAIRPQNRCICQWNQFSTKFSQWYYSSGTPHKLSFHLVQKLVHGK